MLVDPKLKKLPFRPPDPLFGGPVLDGGGIPGIVFNEPLDVAALAGERPTGRSRKLVRALAAAGLVTGLAGAATGSGNLSALAGGISRGAGMRAQRLSALDESDERLWLENLARLQELDVEGQQANVQAQNNMIRDRAREDATLARQLAVEELEADHQRELEEFKHESGEFDRETRRMNADTSRYRAETDRRQEGRLSREAKEAAEAKFQPSMETKDLFKAYDKWRTQARGIKAGTLSDVDSDDEKVQRELVAMTWPMQDVAWDHGLTLEELMDLMDVVRRGDRTEEEFEALLRQMR